MGQRSVKGSEVSAIFSSAENWYSLGAGLGHKLTGPSGLCCAPSETASQQHNGNATQMQTLVRYQAGPAHRSILSAITGLVPSPHISTLISCLRSDSSSPGEPEVQCALISFWSCLPSVTNTVPPTSRCSPLPPRSSLSDSHTLLEAAASEAASSPCQCERLLFSDFLPGPAGTAGRFKSPICLSPP